MSIRYKYIKFFIFIVLFTIFIFWGINWGTPSVKKTLQIFNSFTELEKYVPIMVELRNKFYSSLKKIHTENDIQTNIQKTYVHNLKSKPFEEMPLEVKLDATRGYFLGTINSDEQHNIVGISNLNPQKLDFNPDNFAWGGLHFYIVAASFLVGKILGLISLSQDITYYFFNPQEVSNMYTLIRTISTVSVIITFCILFLFIKKYFRQQGINPWIAGILLLSLPMVLPNAKIAKPHILGMMFVLLGSYFGYKVFDSDELKNYLLSGLFYGCAFSVLYTNFISIFILYFIELVKQNFKISKIVNKKVIFATVIFVSIFLLTNWYIIPDFDKFLRRKKELEIIFNYGNFNFVQSIKFCKCFFIQNLPWYFLPIFVGGVYWILRNKETRLYPFLMFVLLHTLFVILYMKHENVFIISVPFVVTISVYGIYKFIKHNSYLLPSYSFVVIIYLIINFVFQNTLFTKEGNITLCGEWINKNILPGSTVGVKDGWFCVGSFPPIRFLDYKLVHIPSNTNWAVEDSVLPEYLISVDNDIEQMPGFISTKHRYKMIFCLPGRKFLLWKRNKSIPTENIEVKIYKRI